MKAIVIIPTFNERENIEKLIGILENDIFPQIKNYEMGILVVDDNSPDGTAEVVRDLMKKWSNLDLSVGEKEGLGAAYVRGMNYAIEKLNADVMFEMDADLQHDPKKVPDFLQKIDEGNDLVIGNRYSDGGSIPSNWPLQRKLFSITANLFVRFAFFKFSIHDWTGGFRVLKKEVFLKEKSSLSKFKGYTFQVSFLHKAVRDNFKIGQVPFHFSDRTLGDSKIAPREYIFDLLEYIIIARIKELERFIKFLIVGGTGFIVQLITQEIFARIIFAAITTESLRDGFSAGFGAEAAIISNFMFNNFWTFSDTKHVKQNSNFFVKLIKFNISGFLSVFIQFASVFIFVHIFGEDIAIAGITIKTRIAILFPTIIFLIIPLNYLIYNKIIWKTQHLKDKK
ncbi:MAG: glycosyltransferase family 2 protein [Patescibacteria group bacterium]